MARWLPALFACIFTMSVSDAKAQNDAKTSTRPIGNWERKCDDGSKVVICIQERSLSVEIEIPGNGTTSFEAPSYEVTNEGVVYGYFGDIEWKDEVNSRKETNVKPFAFRVKSGKGSIEVADVRIFGADEKEQRACAGTYHPCSEEIFSFSIPPGAVH